VAARTSSSARLLPRHAPSSSRYSAAWSPYGRSPRVRKCAHGTQQTPETARPSGCRPFGKQNIKILRWTTSQTLESCYSTILPILLRTGGGHGTRSPMRELMGSQIPDTASCVEWPADRLLRRSGSSDLRNLRCPPAGESKGSALARTRSREGTFGLPAVNTGGKGRRRCSRARHRRRIRTWRQMRPMPWKGRCTSNTRLSNSPRRSGSRRRMRRRHALASAPV